MEVYLLSRRNSATVKDAVWLARDAVLAKARERLDDRGPFRVKLRGGEYGADSGMPAMLRRVGRLLDAGGDGDAVWISDSDGIIWTVRIGHMVIQIPPAPSIASRSVQSIWNFVYRECERYEATTGRRLHIVQMGTAVCKWINGVEGGTPSQHCWGPPKPDGGNAMDWVVKNADGSVNIKATDHIVERIKDKRYVAQTLWRGVANHYPYHVHNSGSPMRQGVPVCLR